MKQILVAGFITSALFFSFTKQNDGSHRQQSQNITIDTTLASGSLYSIDLQPYGDADDVATITKQATNFTRSEIVNAAASFAPTYYFSAQGNEKLPVSEQVVIAVTEGNHGQNHPNTDTSWVTINFTVQ